MLFGNCISYVCSSDLLAESLFVPLLSAECWLPLCSEFSSFRSSICRYAAGSVRSGLLLPVRRNRSPIMRRVFVLTLTSFLGACQLAPPHARPALPTTRDYPTSYAGDGVLGRRAVEISWREFFADPQLETLIATALERNRDLAVAVAQIQEARGLYRIQGAERLPALGANGDVTRSRTPGSAIGIPEVGAITDTRYSIGVGVTGFELDFWGRVRNLSDAARSQYLATVQAERAFRLALIRDVASTYFASREADERIALAEATVRSRQAGLRIAERRLEAGVTSALDFRQAESLLTNTETEFDSLRLAEAPRANFRAVLLVGLVHAVLTVPLPLADQTNGTVFAVDSPSELMVTRAAITRYPD